jgi:hypothetical protein
VEKVGEELSAKQVGDEAQTPRGASAERSCQNFSVSKNPLKSFFREDKGALPPETD